MKAFNQKPKDVKIGILEFFKDEEMNIRFTFSEDIVEYLEDMKVPKKKLFSENFMAWGKIKNISQDGMLYITLNNKDEMTIPVFFVKDISLKKEEEKKN